MPDDNALDLIAALSPTDRKRFQSAMWDQDDPGRPYRLMLLLRSASPHERERFYAGLPPAEDDRVRLTLLLDTLRCPNTCQHCLVEEGGPPHRKSLAEIQSLVDRLQTEADSAGVWLFRVYPGYKEPLAHPEFFEIDMFLANRFPRHNEAWTSERGVPTNGWAIARDPEFLGRLMRHRPKLNSIQLTLGALGERHDRFAGRKGAFADIELAAKRALAAGLHINWVYVMHRGNIEHHPAFLLGNVSRDPLSVIMERYRRNAVPAQHARQVLGLHELAAKYGQSDGDELHDLCSICRTLVYRHLGIPCDADFGDGRECRVGAGEEFINRRTPMNETLTTIHSVHSTHGDFSDRHVSDEDVETILAASVRAGNAGNAQNYAIIVSRDKTLMKEVCCQAPVMLVYCVDTQRNKDLARWLEPRAASPAQRLDLLTAANHAGIATWVFMAPLIPGLTATSAARSMLPEADARVAAPFRTARTDSLKSTHEPVK